MIFNTIDVENWLKKTKINIVVEILAMITILINCLEIQCVIYDKISAGVKFETKFENC